MSWRDNITSLSVLALRNYRVGEGQNIAETVGPGWPTQRTDKEIKLGGREEYSLLHASVLVVRWSYGKTHTLRGV